MPYREATPPEPSPESAELDAYEQQLRRRAKRKQRIIIGVIAALTVFGVGSCVGPVVLTVAEDAWHRRKTKLTNEEQQRVSELLGNMEENAKKSQAAFEAIWPTIREHKIGARRDLGSCRVTVPGPNLRMKDESRSLEDSAQAYGWTFVDLTPATARSPIAHLNMPRGSIAMNNTPGAQRFALPSSPLRRADPDHPPTLASTAAAAKAAELREEAEHGIRADWHKDYLRRVEWVAEDGLGIDVVVFLDAWHDPKMTDEMAPEPPPAKNAYDEFTRPVARPTRLFDSGFAIAHAIAWDPEKQEVACASQALALSSEHITFRTTDLAPLRQDLVLQLEHALERSFVAVGEAPPKLEAPKRGAIDGGTPGDGGKTDPSSSQAPSSGAP